MTRAGTFIHLNRLRLACIVGFVVMATIGARPAHGQASVEPVIDPSPMIAQGHLEGGINGDESPRPDGKTPLMLAVEANDLKVIEYLLQHGVDPDLQDADGETALDLAQRRMNHAAAVMLSAHASAHPGSSAYYAGKSPVLSVISARSQSGSPGCAAPHSLVVLVTDHDGNPLVDAPVCFAVDGGGKYLLTQASSPDSPSLLLRSDGSGQCRANLHLPKAPNTRIHVTARAGTGERAANTSFVALTNDGTGGGSTSCYDPTNLSAQASSDGSADLSWQNNTDDETAIKVWVRTREGWKLVQTLPPHSTSVHLPSH